MDCTTCKERMAELHFDPTYHYRGTRYGLSSCDVCPNYDPEDNQPVKETRIVHVQYVYAENEAMELRKEAAKRKSAKVYIGIEEK